VSGNGGHSRNWLAEALARRAARHPDLEQTLFRRLQDLENGPLEQLGGLVRHVIDELRVAQRRVSEQAAELRSLRDTVAALSDRLARVEQERVERERAEEPRPAPAVAPEPEPEPAPEPGPKPKPGHVLLLALPSGYRLVERDGPPPAAGEAVEHDGVRFRVLGPQASPLPGDQRPSLLGLPGPSEVPA
jgi:hypothetical protein